MSEMRSALDDLAAIDLGELSEDALLDLVGELSTTANRVAAALTSAVRAADRGSRIADRGSRIADRGSPGGLPP